MNYGQNLLNYLDLSENIRKAMASSARAEYIKSPKMAIVNSIVMWLLCIPLFMFWYTFDLSSTYTATSSVLNKVGPTLPAMSFEATRMLVVLLTVTPTLYEMVTAKFGQFELPWISGACYFMILFDGLSDFEPINQFSQHFFYPFIVDIVGQGMLADSLFWIIRAFFLIQASVFSGPMLVVMMTSAFFTMLIGVGNIKLETSAGGKQSNAYANQ